MNYFVTMKMDWLSLTRFPNANKLMYQLIQLALKIEMIFHLFKIMNSANQFLSMMILRYIFYTSICASLLELHRKNALRHVLPKIVISRVFAVAPIQNGRI